MPAMTRPASWPAGMMELVVCATMLVVGLGLTRPTQAAPRAADIHAGLSVRSAEPLTRFQAPPFAGAAPLAAATPLASALQPDGSLNLAAGFRGRLDARGWRLASGLGAAPRWPFPATKTGPIFLRPPARTIMSTPWRWTGAALACTPAAPSPRPRA